MNRCKIFNKGPDTSSDRALGSEQRRCVAPGLRASESHVSRMGLQSSYTRGSFWTRMSAIAHRTGPA